MPAKRASARLLGVVAGHDEFDFFYRATLPEMTEAARMWLPFPATDAFQTVIVRSLTAPGQYLVLDEREYGNKVLVLEGARKATWCAHEPSMTT